jgi:23S rRNA (uracil1939-C5)-methyltransferase
VADAVTIESLGSGGAGVTHLPDGMIAFVPRTVPGDQVTLRDIRLRKRHAEARVADIVAPGPGRVDPPCEHYTKDRCGGCQWQHVSADVQGASKRRIVGDALRRIGKLDVPDPELVASPRAFGYRSTISLTVRKLSSRTIAGFHNMDDPDVVFPLERCWIARDELNDLWRAVRRASSALPSGDDVRLKLRLAPDGTRHVLVSGGDRAWSGGPRVAQALDEAGIVATVWWQPLGGAPRAMAGAEGDAASVAFEQVNPEVAELLKNAVIEEAGRRADGRTGRVLDLYAGSGDTAIPLAQAGHDVAMVEQDKRSVRRAEERAEQAGVPLKAIAGQVEDNLEKLLPADVVIVNPPRAGLAEVVTARLSACPSARLVYVSCDPATLARDLKRLGVTSDRILGLKAFDMFPQTSHVETLLIAALS